MKQIARIGSLLLLAAVSRALAAQQLAATADYSAATASPFTANMAALTNACLPALDAPTEAAAEAANRNAQAPVDEAKLSYVDDPMPLWRDLVPELKHVQLEPDAAAANPCIDILRRTGIAVLTTLQKVPNLAAHEKLAQLQITLPYTKGYVLPNGMALGLNTSTGGRGGSTLYGSKTDILEGEELHRTLHNVLEDQTHHIEFGYRIRAVPDKQFGVMLEEFRTDDKNQRVDVSMDRDAPRDIGFSNSWLLLSPVNLHESRFRYIGKQRLGKRETFVLAFEQRPGKVRSPATLSLVDGLHPFLRQGIVWIDAENYQILRLQTDISGVAAGTTLSHMRTDVELNEIKIPQIDLHLWLPIKVEVNWETKDAAGAELHAFSNYRLFQSTSRIVAVPAGQ